MEAFTTSMEVYGSIDGSRRKLPWKAELLPRKLPWKSELLPWKLLLLPRKLVMVMVKVRVRAGILSSSWHSWKLVEVPRSELPRNFSLLLWKLPSPPRMEASSTSKEVTTSMEAFGSFQCP